MSARRNNVLRMERYRKPKCPKCGSKKLLTKEYEDGYNLIICQNGKCQFPQRVKRETA